MNESIQTHHSLRVLALEPYHGGSHKAFLDGWSAGSRHAWTVLGYPANKWKWRMKHAAVTFADLLRGRVERGEQWDVLWCSDMLDLATLKGLAPDSVQRLPSVAYFHENQFTYPLTPEQPVDYTYGFINAKSGLAADAVWFNSAHNRDSFLDALDAFLHRMPNHGPENMADRIREKSSIVPQGIDPVKTGTRGPSETFHVLWAARWEYDKDPELFFSAMREFKQTKADFRMSVIGERFRAVPECFESARSEFAKHIAAWGYQESRQSYEDILRNADVIVSTAQHEFFGITLIEALSAGAFPLVPRKLAYPEILRADENPEFFHEGTADSICSRLLGLARQKAAASLWNGNDEHGIQLSKSYWWPTLAPALDTALEGVARGSGV